MAEELGLEEEVLVRLELGRLFLYTASPASSPPT